jgi:hypothetical protein
MYYSEYDDCIEEINVCIHDVLQYRSTEYSVSPSLQFPSTGVLRTRVHNAYERRA